MTFVELNFFVMILPRPIRLLFPIDDPGVNLTALPI